MTFKDIVDGCRAMAAAGRIELKESDPDLLAVKSPLFDLDAGFRTEDGAYDYRVHTLSLAPGENLIPKLLRRPQEATFEPVRFYLVNGRSPRLKELARSAARNDPFFIGVGPFPENAAPQGLESLAMSDLGILAYPVVAILIK